MQAQKPQEVEFTPQTEAWLKRELGAANLPAFKAYFQDLIVNRVPMSRVRKPKDGDIYSKSAFLVGKLELEGNKYKITEENIRAYARDLLDAKMISDNNQVAGLTRTIETTTATIRVGKLNYDLVLRGGPYNQPDIESHLGDKGWICDRIIGLSRDGNKVYPQGWNDEIDILTGKTSIPVKLEKEKSDPFRRLIALKQVKREEEERVAAKPEEVETTKFTINVATLGAITTYIVFLRGHHTKDELTKKVTDRLWLAQNARDISIIPAAFGEQSRIQPVLSVEARQRALDNISGLINPDQQRKIVGKLEYDV